MNNATLQSIDHTGLKVGTGITLVLLIIAFLLDSWLLVAFVALCQICGALALPFAPYRLMYQHVIKPIHLVQPYIIQDHMAPHRFAMFLGAVFNGIGALFLTTGNSFGWVLVGIVFILANLQFWLNFCAGCWLYYLLNRSGVPGFDKSHPSQLMEHDAS